MHARYGSPVMHQRTCLKNALGRMPLDPENLTDWSSSSQSKPASPELPVMRVLLSISAR